MKVNFENSVSAGEGGAGVGVGAGVEVGAVRLCHSAKFGSEYRSLGLSTWIRSPVTSEENGRTVSAIGRLFVPDSSDDRL